MSLTPVSITNVEEPGPLAAWKVVMRSLCDKAAVPYLVSFAPNNDVKNLIVSQEYREAREYVASHGCIDPDVTANTIFPMRLWWALDSIGGCEQEKRQLLYETYKRGAFPYMKARNKRCNGNGTYFQRFAVSQWYDHKSATLNEVNQLEVLFERYNKKKTRRLSGLTLQVYDPGRDSTHSPYQGFPCLIHVAIRITKDDKLSLSATYAVQYGFARALGNYLGLQELGRFIARATNTELVNLTIYASSLRLGREKIEEDGKNVTRPLMPDLRTWLT